MLTPKTLGPLTIMTFHLSDKASTLQNTWTHVSAIHHLSSNSQNQKRKALHIYIYSLFFIRHCCCYFYALQWLRHPFDTGGGGDDDGGDDDSIARWNVKHHLYIVLFYAEGIVKGCAISKCWKLILLLGSTSNRNILRILTPWTRIHTRKKHTR